MSLQTGQGLSSTVKVQSRTEGLESPLDRQRLRLVKTAISVAPSPDFVYISYTVFPHVQGQVPFYHYTYTCK